MSDIHIIDSRDTHYFVRPQVQKTKAKQAVKTNIPQQQKGSVISKEELEKIKQDLKKYNNQLQFHDKEVKLSINEEIDRLIVTVINKKTNKVIYEYPYEEIQHLAKHLKDLSGFMYDVQA